MTNVLDKTESKGLSGSILKIIACVTMFIDHTAFSIVRQMQLGDTTNFDSNGELIKNGIYYLFHVMRGIGRIAFPIFIFMLVEGYFHTDNRWLYLLRMAVFAIISEVPYDVAFNLTQRQMLEGKFIEFTDQNVFFTLFLGLLAVIISDTLLSLDIDIMLKLVLSGAFAVGLAAIAYFMKTDYDAVGVCAIEAAYLFRKSVKIIGYEEEYPIRCNVILAGLICTILLFSGVKEVFAYAILPLCALYNGKRGQYMKYTFYVFYPLHLLILGLIKFIMFE